MNKVNGELQVEQFARKLARVRKLRMMYRMLLSISELRLELSGLSSDCWLLAYMASDKLTLLEERCNPYEYGSNACLDEEAIAIGRRDDGGHSSREALNELGANWSLTFRDGRRRTDFVLVFNKAAKNAENAKKRQIFEENLIRQGLELEYENAFKGELNVADRIEDLVENQEINSSTTEKKETRESLSYVKIHAPEKVLKRYAETLKMIMPIRKRLDELVRVGKVIRGAECRQVLNEQGYKADDSDFGESLGSEPETRPSQAQLLQMPPDVAQQDTWLTKMYRKLNMYPEVENIEYRTAMQFARNRHYLFDDAEQLFKPKDRTYIVDYILQRESYVRRSEETVDDATVLESRATTGDGAADRKKKVPNEMGIGRLLANNVYLAAYPLHDCPLDVKEEEELLKYKDTLRYKLWRQWARWGMAFKLQPLSHIQLYFGDTIAFYFAWLGFYTTWLVPLTIIGFIIFIYGVIVASTDTITAELMASNSTMCPLCIEGCTYWAMANQRSNLIIARVWENEATFVWGIVVTLWCTLFIEYWKRREGVLRFEWNLFKLEHEDEPMRPEYASLVQTALANPEGKIKVKLNPVTNKEEPHVPYWSVKVPNMLVSWVTVFVAIIFVLISVVGTILYRVALLTFFYRTGGFLLVTFGSTIASITGACISLLFIMILAFIYDRVAVWLTDREYWRTQTEYNDALMIKQTLFQFVNYYGSIFYVAFFKGNFGTVGEYAFTVTHNPSEAPQTSLDFGIETCPSGSCIPDLTIQLAIVMVGKQLVYGNLMELLFPKIMKYLMDCIKKSDNDSQVSEIPKNLALFGNYDLEANGTRPLFSEYLEMIIQFGFLSIFAIAFPFAPLFALINNIVEIRLDGMKFLKDHRRVVASFDTGIGTWLTSLYAISRIAILSNGALIAFTSDLIPRLIYDYQYKSQNTYENFTMSYLNTTVLGQTNRTFTYGRKQTYIDPPFCLYNDYRNPPWITGDELPYDYSKLYWIILGYRFITFAIFENVILFVTSLVAAIIPDVPKETEEEMRRERYFGRKIMLALDEEFTKIRLGSTRKKLSPKAAQTSRVSAPRAGASSSRAAETPYYDLPPVEKTSKQKRKSNSKPAELEMNPVSSTEKNDQVSVTNVSNF